MLKQLLKEAKTINASVELDSIFESVQLSPEVKANFEVVFEQAVKTNAAKLAETHILEVIEKAESTVEQMVAERINEVESKLYEDTERYFDHITKEWLAENAKAVDNEIKANLFESMLVGMKELFIEHNVEVPTESIDVVAELESELEESNQEVKTLFDKNVMLQEELKGVKREVAINKAVSELTESQKEKVVSLVEGISFNDQFEHKLNAIVSVMSSDTHGSVSEDHESTVIVENINTVDTELNYGDKADKPAKTVNPLMASYINAAIKIR